MVTEILITLLCLLAAGSDPATCPYPNELAKYRFCHNAKWNSLMPLESTLIDVLRVMGEPVEASDIANYLTPYPGHAKAVQPVFTYDGGSNWQILIYFVKSDATVRNQLSEPLGDRLLSIDLVPKNRLPFRANFPPAFTRSHEIAADAAWDDYTDGTGLHYEIYTTRTPYGGDLPGDLNRISYGPSDEQMRQHARQ